MERTFSVDGGGRIQLLWEGGRVEVAVERPDDGLGLYKAWLCGVEGGQILVGTLAPEGGRLKRRRWFYIRELEATGCWPVKDGKILLAFPFEHRNWYCEQHPERLVADPILRAQIKGAMMCCRDGDSVFLALPFRKEISVMLNAVFCFGRVEIINGSLHIVWKFSKSGVLLPPDKEGGAGNCGREKGGR